MENNTPQHLRPSTARLPTTRRRRALDRAADAGARSHRRKALHRHALRHEGRPCAPRLYVRSGELPASGTKPTHRNEWFDIVHGERRAFVANTIEDIAKVFPDHELIKSLGCESVINLPVYIGGEMLGTVNCLDVAHHYTPERVERALALLNIPSKLAFLAAKG